MLQGGFKLIKPMVIALIGVYFSNRFNVFDYMSFIPKYKAFDICITVYFAILEIMGEIIIENVKTRFMSNLTVILSLNNAEVSIESTPIINFNSADLAEATINVYITGRKKHFSGAELRLSNVGFATMQASVRDREVSVDNAGNYIIDLEKMFGTTDKRTTVSSSFRVVLVKEPTDGEKTIEISPELKKAFSIFKVIYKHNKAWLKVER